MKKKIEEMLKNKFNVLLISIVAIFTIYYSGFIANKLSGVRCFYNNSDSVSYIDISTPKTFSLPVNTDNLSAIQFPFVIENKDLTDDELKKIKFDIIIKGVKGLCLTTDVLSNGAGEHFLKIFLAPRVHNKNNKDLNVTVSCVGGVSLLKNDCGDVIYKLNGLKKLVISGVVILFIVSIAFCYFVFYVTRNWKLENRFLLYALVLGMAYIFVRAPLTQNDEFYHFDTAYNMSNIMLGYGSADTNETLLKRKCDLDLIPKLYQIFYPLDTHDYVRNGGRDFYKHLLSNFNKSIDEELLPSPSTRVMKTQRTFIFSAAAIAIARILHLNQFITWYSGCIVNLFIAMFLIYFSLKLNKKYQYVFASISLLPNVIIDLGSYSYDVLTISVAFFVINLAYYIYDGHVKNIKVWIVFILASLFIFPIKRVYFTIPFLFFFLYFYSRNIKRRILFSLASVLGIYFIVFIAAEVISIPFFFNRAVNNYDDIYAFTYSIKDVITHPISFISLIISKLVELDWRQLVDFAPLYAPPFFRYILMFCMLLLFFKGNQDKINLSVAISSFTVFIIVFLLLCLVCIVWTHYGEFSLWGIQARYLFPVLPLIFISVRNVNICSIVVNEKFSFYLILTVTIFFLINLFLQSIFWVGFVG